MSAILARSADLSVERDLRRRLRAAWLQWWLMRLLVRLFRGLALGLLLAALSRLALGAAGHDGDVWVLGLVAVPLGCAVVVGLIRRPRVEQAARRLDLRWHLADRLGTATELLDRDDAGLLKRRLIADAEGATRGLPRWLPCGVPAFRAELFAVAGAALALWWSTSHQLPAVRWESARPEPRIEPEAAVLTPAQPSPPAVGAAARRDVGPTNPKTSAALRLLDELRARREQGQLSPDQAAAMLGQAESLLNSQAVDSRGRQAALQQLARALEQSSVTADAARSVRDGDLAEAASSLEQLGREADQLSTEARQQLGESLRRAANASQALPSLADRERRAADALQRGDYQATQQALAALAREVGQTRPESADAGQLQAALDRLDQERQLAGLANASRPGDAEGSRPGEAASPGGQGEPRAGRPGEMAQAGQNNGRGQPGGSQHGEGTERPAGSGAIDAPSPRLDLAPRSEEVTARASPDGKPGGRRERADGGPPGGAGSEVAAETAASAGVVEAGDREERVQLSPAQREIVRGFFADRARGSAP